MTTRSKEIREQEDRKMATKLGEYFNYRGSRYYRIYKGGLSHELALKKLAQRISLAPQFKWAIHREADGWYSIGRAIDKTGG